MADAEIREYLKTHTYYQYETHEALQLICSKISQRDDTKEVQLTDEFDSPSLADETIAYHRVFGVVTANSYWYFSSKQMEQDIVAAENNPQISAHLLHINSPGGEAWYMDRLSETLRNAKSLSSPSMRNIAHLRLIILAAMVRSFTLRPTTTSLDALEPCVHSGTSNHTSRSWD